MSNLVLKYIGGLAIGAAVIGGYGGVRHVMRDQPTVLPSREEPAKEPIAPPPESGYISVEPAPYVPVEPAPYAERAEAPTDVSDLPKACESYVRAMARLVECEAMPDDGRAAMREGLRATREAWNSLEDMSAETKQQMENACGQADDAIREGAKSMGCQL